MALLEHNKLDRFIEQWLCQYIASGRPIYCDSGCAGCCSLAVHATYPEATEAARHLTDKQIRQLYTYLQRLQQRLPELKSLKDYLKQHRENIGPCPFIDGHSCCGIYPARPLSCRALLSTRPAEWCSVDFSELDPLDKQAFESGLNRDIVAWPTHYVAVTQDFAREAESQLLLDMKQERGWALSGNFAVMVWLETEYCLSQSNLKQEQIQQRLTDNHLDNSLILRFF